VSTETTAEIVKRYREGDGRAAEELFARYVDRLTRLARSHLSPKLAARTDPEDVVMSAYRSFFIGARDGRFSLARSGDLWRLLVSITMNKLYRQVRRHRAASRSINSEILFNNDEVLGTEPTPEQVIGIADELEALLKKLDSFERRVLELRLQEESLDEIASETGRSERTVRRTLSSIRELLSRQLERGEDD
jgi:RNA polymerase sigma factor (sigma-70 family)